MRYFAGSRVILLFSAIAVFTIFGGIGLTPGSIVPAFSQTGGSVSVDFHVVLDGHGRWEHDQRWGDVWIPASRGNDWRPYTHGHWGYTDEWGWYWISAEDERDWGWVVFHYGRWIFDPRMGWVWIPRTEWGPAWVDWRRGSDHIGWAPLPPEEIIADVEPRADIWVFVRARDFVAPRISTVVLDRREYDVFVRKTVVVNRTIIEEHDRIAINPGIEPSYIAAAVGHPLHTVEVRPAVLAGTANVPNAIEVRASDARQAARETVVERQQTVIQPAQNIPAPRALSPGEKGRLGEHPPTAARQTQESERAAHQPQPAQPNRAGVAGQPPRPGATGRPEQQRGTATGPQPPGPPAKAGMAQQPQQPKGSQARKQAGKNPQATGQLPEQQIPGKVEPRNRGRTSTSANPQSSKPEKHGAAPINAQQRGAAATPSTGQRARAETGREEPRGRPEQRRATAKSSAPERRGAESSATSNAGSKTGREEQRRPEQRSTASMKRQHGPSTARDEASRAAERGVGPASAQQARSERGPAQAAQAQRGRPEARRPAEQHGALNTGARSGRSDRSANPQAESARRRGPGMAQAPKHGARGPSSPAKEPRGRGPAEQGR